VAGTAAAMVIAGAGVGNQGPTAWRAGGCRHHQMVNGEVAGPQGGARRLTGEEERRVAKVAAALVPRRARECWPHPVV